MFNIFNNKKQVEKEQKIREIMKLVAKYGAHKSMFNDEFFDKVAKDHGEEASKRMEEHYEKRAENMRIDIYNKLRAL